MSSPLLTRLKKLEDAVAQQEPPARPAIDLSRLPLDVRKALLNAVRARLQALGISRPDLASRHPLTLGDLDIAPEVREAVCKLLCATGPIPGDPPDCPGNRSRIYGHKSGSTGPAPGPSGGTEGFDVA